MRSIMSLPFMILRRLGGSGGEGAAALEGVEIVRSLFLLAGKIFVFSGLPEGSNDPVLFGVRSCWGEESVVVR